MYYLQALLLATLGFALLSPWFPNRAVLAALCALWLGGVVALYWQYGMDGQMTFYSNDQELHLFLMGKLEWGGRPLGIRDLIDRRYLYVGSAYLLTLIGFGSAIALKFISFICFLVNAVVVHRYFGTIVPRTKVLYLWLATGPIVFFFSLLALRETMLLLALTYLFIGKNFSLRMFGFITIGLLRPHLAVAIAMAVATVWIVQRIKPSLYYVRMAVATVGSVMLGIFIYSVAYTLDNRTDLTFARSVVDKDKAYLVLSNLVGLQFLNADFVAIERSLTDLLLPRLVFPETVLIPILFTITLFIPNDSIDRLKISVITTFGYYIGIISGSDFTSFRQNLPFVSVMAILIIQTFRRERSQKPSSTLLLAS